MSDKSLDQIEKVIQDIVEKLRRDYSPQRIILFGSFAEGNPRRGSDIDLLIIKETSERFIDRWVTVRRILTDPQRKVSLDTFVLTPEEIKQRVDVGDQFIIEILEQGKVLYDAEGVAVSR
ncbi:MAG: nucleotidyltransferase domain-containing protein [Ignavibacteriae bacterium]|nr:nucleotidyltransferase domain-containing protein [Ignavibacteriota bacterium]